MSDITLFWNPNTQSADWQIISNDLAVGDDLETAIILSLFTDRPAQPDFRFPDGSKDRAGWWGDAYEPSPLGSRLRQLRRAKISGASNLLLVARDICNEALQWLLDDNIVASITVSTSWLNSNTMNIGIIATEPVSYKTQVFNYSWAWQALKTVIAPTLDTDFTLDQSSLD